MASDNSGLSASTVVTKVTSKRESGVQPMMSFTAVTTHRSMAEAFLQELLKHGKKLLHDHDFKLEDLTNICHIVLEQKEKGVVMLEGRHLRGRIGEQLSRAKRYNESFSLISVKMAAVPDDTIYDSLIDTLCERMRKTDLMFLFKSCIVLILPHTNLNACQTLEARIRNLMLSSIDPQGQAIINTLTYPSDDIEKTSSVLDWAEDQLR